MVLITGQVPRPAMGTDAFQEAPVFNIMAPCAKHVFLVTDEAKVEATMRTAFHIARSGRPARWWSTSHATFQLAKSVFRGGGLLHMRGYEERLEELEAATLAPAAAEAFWKLLARAEHPLIYAGGG